MPRNSDHRGNTFVPKRRETLLIERARQQLTSRLPSGWQVSDGTPTPDFSGFDCVLEIISPDGRKGRMVIEAKESLSPRAVYRIAARIREVRLDDSLIVVSPYLSQSTREQLRESGLNYLDLTGNTWIQVEDPAVYIETQGASRDPYRRERPARSLRGPKAGRIVRSLIDIRAMPTVRELAARAGVNPGYVSRVLTLLDEEALVTRNARGRLEFVDWKRLLERWAREMPLAQRSIGRTYLEPRGLGRLQEKLKVSALRYAITGSLAASTFAPVAPPRLASVWVENADELSQELDLRPAEAGANVLLLEPVDDLVFLDSWIRNGLTFVAPSQVAADLLTSPGRGPAEGEALLAWMKENESEWRR